MSGLIDNLTSVHLIIWAVVGGMGLVLGAFLGRRDATIGNITLIFGVLVWSIFVALVPIVNNAIQPEGLGGLFSGRGFAQFLVDAAPQAILEEPMAHRIEVLIASAIGGVVFSACGFVLAAFIKGQRDG